MQLHYGHQRVLWYTSTLWSRHWSFIAHTGQMSAPFFTVSLGGPSTTSLPSGSSLFYGSAPVWLCICWSLPPSTSEFLIPKLNCITPGTTSASVWTFLSCSQQHYLQGKVLQPLIHIDFCPSLQPKDTSQQSSCQETLKDFHVLILQEEAKSRCNRVREACS